jgi:hypothetical protein
MKLRLVLLGLAFAGFVGVLYFTYPKSPATLTIDEDTLNAMYVESLFKLHHTNRLILQDTRGRWTEIWHD